MSVTPGTDEVQSQRVSTTLLPQLSRFDALIGRDLLDRHQPDFALVDGWLASVAPLSRQREGVSNAYALVLPLLPTDSKAGSCIVVLDRFVRADAVATEQMASLEVTGGAIIGSEVLQATSDPVAAFLDRPGRFLPYLLGMLGAIATIITFRLRSSEFATYRMSGTGIRSLLTLIACETLLVTGVASSSAALSVFVLHDRYLSLATPIWSGVALAGSWAAITVLGTVDLAFRRPIDLAKDR